MGVGSHRPELSGLLEDLRSGNRRALARAITLVESHLPSDPTLGDLWESAGANDGSAMLVGITGPPGAGKSTLVSELVGCIREAHQTVGVVAVDPASPLTGGAMLGDRIRMQRHFTDPGVFIRSMSTRGHLGGLAKATRAVTELLSLAGFEVVLVETVGVGQSEVEVMRVTPTVVVVANPGLGDSVQADKAGLFEIGGVFCVNKADQDGADQAVRTLRQMISLGHRPGPRPQVLTTIATEGQGVPQLWEAIVARGNHADSIP
ncbi:MAG: methylmalonyl Co-A mutase-associated GTPase MeaB [Acidimicrobiia bacterium]|nr:methylmalonyl Co-A mutase-associated GTPase MeaB [Acidimicrobiia bacterium]MYA39381.1 methylmalonyl Co-A mutase-associated GTPase MeaB [Acidimicrobiia bacterium]MYK55365.1 methylmalonyl Co-A mutase-associated GTPase MeaB [Acidimicrobiia bacterium]